LTIDRGHKMAGVNGDMAIGRVGSGHAVGDLRVAVCRSGGHRFMGDVGNSVIADRHIDSGLVVRLGDSDETGDGGTSWGELGAMGGLLAVHS
jgi:hypothetical protein